MADPLPAEDELRIHLLGGFRVMFRGRAVVDSRWALQKARGLVKLLALAPNHRLRREQLMEQLWPDLDVDAAANNLYYALHVARRALGPADQSHGRGGVLRLQQQVISLQPADSLWTDVEAFLAAASVARRTQDAAAYEAAIERYTGDLLPEDRYEDWVTMRRQALRGTYLELLVDAARLHEAQGSFVPAIEALRRAVAADPTVEEAHAALMRLYALTGQRQRALRQYAQVEEVLQRELGATPDTATRRLYEEIRTGRLVPVHEQAAAPIKPHAYRASTAQGTRSAPRSPHQRALTSSERAPLVGRRAELAKLQEAWRLSAAKPRLAIIAGEAGIGKTRLAEEILHRAARQGIATASARCYSAEGDLAYAPVASWLRAEGLWPSLRLLDEVWLTEVARVVPEVLVEHPGVPPPGQLSESWQRTRLFEALTHALHAGGQPLLLVIDDMQWCDRDTLEWLHYLLRSQPHTRLLLVTTLRAEETGVKHPTSALLAALRRDGQLTEIAVPPLSVAETATLAAHVTGAALAPALTTRLYSETEGNALFTVETARTGLLAQWATQAAGDVRDPASGQTSVLAVAPTVQAVIASRLAQLSPGTREMAEVASVIGREFSFDLLAHAVSVDEEALIRSLDELAERRIVREHAADSFDFSHDKIREAAYAGLSPARRRRLHRLVAAAIEQTHAGALEVVSGQVAAHYERAGERELAMRWYEQAAERAHRSDTYEEARRHLQHAIALAPKPEHVRLYERLGDYTTGAPAVQSYAEALKRWRSTGAADPRVGARLLRKTLLNHLRYDTTRPSAEELAALRAEAWRLAETAGDGDERWRIQVTDFFLPSWRRTYAPEGVQEARATALAAAAYFERREEWQPFSEALDGYVALSVNIGAQAEALEAATRRLSIPSLTPQERGDALGTVAELYSDLGEYDRCLAFATEALAGVSPGASVVHLAYLASIATLAACLCGRWSEIARFQATIEETWRQSGRDPSFSVLRLGCFGLLHVALAREDSAAAGAATAILEPLLSGLWGDSNRSLLHAYLDDDPARLDLDPAQRRFYIVFLGLMFLSDRGLSAPSALLNFARAWARAWKVDMALRCVEIADALAADDAARLAQAIEQAEAHGLVPHAARLQIVLAERTGDRAHLERARHVLQRLGDRQFLRRLEALSSSLE